MMIDPRADALKDEMTLWRRHLHANPELGFEEHETARFVADRLRSWGLEVVEAVGGTGVVATLRGRLGRGRSMGLRAELDALPIEETTGVPHASCRPGRMHACGHDGHAVMLLGAARVLAGSRDFAGTLHFIFQPAEEGLGGALAMLDDGLFDRFPCDEIFALHNSERPLGQVVVHDGTVAAATDRFEIVIHGRGGHAAMPHLAIDPLPIAARLLLDLEALPGRLTDAAAPAVVTVASLHAGTAFNTIPGTATLTGTVRCFDPEARQALEDAVRRLADSQARMHGARAEIDYRTIFAPTINTPEQARFVAETAAQVVGAGNLCRNPPPEMGSEDFSFMLQRRPGCYFLLGQGDASHVAAPHDSAFDFNDALLPIGASLWVRLAERRLSPQGGSS
ncbi:MAG: M20 aminoacylase family protein [Kiloniellales bacterium]